jgi:hypothetical protein
VERRVGDESSRHAHDLTAQGSELRLDSVVVDTTVAVEGPGSDAIGTTYGTAQARSARAENSIVLIACRPCMPPAALINPTTLSWRYGGSRDPRMWSQSSEFLNAPETVPLIERAAPEHAVGRVARLDELGGRAGRRFVLAIEHRKRELAQVEQPGLGARLLGSGERYLERRPAV